MGFCPPVDPIVCQPMQLVNHQFYPQVFPVIHPIEIINQPHCIPVPHHVFPVVVKDACVCSHTRSHGKRQVRSSKRK